MSEMNRSTFKDKQTEELWWKLKGVVDSRGDIAEFGTGIVRRADIVFPKSQAELHVTELVDPNDLDGPLAYHMERSDKRGEFELMVSAVADIGAQAVRVATRDIRLYMGATEDSMEGEERRNRASLGTREFLLRHRNNGVMPNVPTQSLLDTYAMYGLKRRDKKQLIEQLKAEGYNDDEAAQVMRLARQPIS